MDEVTQQNAALVEEAAAAAQSLEDQAGKLRTAVAVFQLDDEARKAPVNAAPRRATPPARPMTARKAPPAAHAKASAAPAAALSSTPSAAAPAKAPAKALASAGGDQDWETF